jgi:lipoprotein-anchoring transpeptidase ErfK/SrfK
MRSVTSTFLAGACAALLCSATAVAADHPAYGYDAAQAQQVDPDGRSLRAGEFAWLPSAEVRSDTPVTLLVNLRDQRAYLYRDGQRIAVTTVSTGKPGNDTPTGVFPIMGKAKVHFSNRYNNAPMPWMQRLTQWGHALHAGQVRPYPASHGCVRLPAEFAKQLFSLTRTGDLVIISQDDTPRSLAIALAVAGMDNRTALTVGVTEPLPQIVFYEPGQEPARRVAEQAGAGGTAF